MAFSLISIIFIVGILIFIVIAIFAISIIAKLVLAKSNDNLASSTTVSATFVSRRTDEGDSNCIKNFITFKTDSGQHLEFEVKNGSYADLTENYRGQLTFRGTTIKSFK